MVLDRARHGRRRLAGTDDDEPPRTERLRRGQVRRNAERRLRARDRGVEHPPQQGPRIHGTGAPASYQRLTSARSSSVICVALLNGISFSTTACW